MGIVPLRHFDRCVLVPPAPGSDYVSFAEPATPGLLWRILGRRVDDVDRGRALFTGTMRQKNALHRSFRNYVQQGRAYFEAGDAVSGRSAALLYYYAFLNLAKAELLVKKSSVLADKVRHGLIFKPGDQLLTGHVEVSDGVFPNLYTARTGLLLMQGTKIPIRRVFACIPEIGWDFEQAGGTSTTVEALSVVVSDDQSTWTLLMVSPTEVIESHSDLTRHLARNWDVVEWTPTWDWRDTFAVSRRARPMGAILQQRHPLPRDKSGDLQWPEVTAARRQAWEQLSPFIDYSTDPAVDAVLCASLYRNRRLVLPPSLARYLATFFLSSVVRYRPDLLDPRDHGADSLLSESVAKDTAIPLLINAINGIEPHPHLFGGGTRG